MIVVAFIILGISSTIVYLSFVLRAIVGLVRKPEYDSDIQIKEAISVIVPFRNEAKRLPHLLESLKGAIIRAPQDIQVILVNDHSDDGFTLVNSEFEIYNLEEKTGKKAAIDLGINQAKHDKILTLDADVHIELDFFKFLDIKWTAQDLFIVPVVGNQGNAVLELESHALCALNIGSALYGRAIMCNGAALGFRKKALSDVEIRHKNLASGDDMFLLEAFKKGGKSISGALQTALIVSTNLPSSFRSFSHQRIRWAGKSRFTSDWELILFGIATIVMYLSLILGFFVLESNSYWLILAVYGIKLFIDYLLLFLFHIKTGLNGKWWAYPILGIAYPLYSLYIGLMSIVIKPRWKGRQV